MHTRDETLPTATQLAVIGVPSSAGARRTGQEAAPAALRAAGLLDQLRGKGLDVTDLGDLARVPYHPDPEHPRQQNLRLVMEVASQVADRVEEAVAHRRLPIVLGGDCSLTLGVLTGLLRHHQRLGLLYFDGDVDLNTPETTSSGIFDGMVLAHVLGRGAPELAGIGPRRPLLSEEDIVLFGYHAESGWIDPSELEVLEHSRMAKYPRARVRTDADAAARDALSHLENRSDAILVHFDVDVMNFPAADVPHPHGLDFASAFAALKLLVSAPSCVGVVITEFNAECDPDGSQARRLVDGLVDALGARAGMVG